ncbi:MAG: glycosyltransferase family 4 protein [Patescibacteria group bacterium]
MKILIATGLYPPDIGGPATYTVLLEKELPLQGYVVQVLPFAISRGFPKVIRHIHYAGALWRKAKTADIIFAQDVASVGWPALVIAKLLRKEFIVRVPGDYAWEQSVQRYGVVETIDQFQKKSYGLKVGLLRFIQTSVTKYADQVITPSNYFKQVVTGWGVLPQKITTIYNGVDLKVEAAPVKKPAAFTVVSAGRLVPWKGFMTLIEIIKDNPRWHLVILGDGKDRLRLQTQINESGLKDRVVLAGAVSRAEIFGWCKAADVFVLNTEFESFSYQIVEAMSVGAAIITTKVGSIPELITPGIEGILCEPNDKVCLTEAIKSIEHSPEIWLARKRAAEAKAQTFSINRTVTALVTVLKRYA